MPRNSMVLGIAIALALALAPLALDRPAGAGPVDAAGPPPDHASGDRPPPGIERFTIFSDGRADAAAGAAAAGRAAHREDAAPDSSVALVVAASLTAMLAATHRGRGTSLVS